MPPDEPTIRRRTVLALAAVPLGACTLDPDVDHADEHAPRVEPLRRQPGVAWVFGSGGPRGFTHVGVLKALDELGLAPDLIVGASAGAVVGVLRASGLTAAALEEIALETQLLEIARYAWGSAERLSSLGLAGWLGSRLATARLEAMPTMAACVTYNLARRQVVTFTAGDAAVAAAASSAIEGQLTPVRIRGELHADADWHQPLPVRVARAMGARRVVAVDASVHLDRTPPGAERYRAGDLRKKALVDADASHADLVLKPDFGYWVSLRREFRERAIEAGYREAMANTQALHELHRAAAT